METPVGHDQNADQIAYWNGPGGQRWTDRQQAQDILLAPVSDILDRPRRRQGRASASSMSAAAAARPRSRSRAGRAVGACARRRHLGADAGAGAQLAPKQAAGRLRAGRRHGLSLRSRKLRSPGLALWRDVLRRPAVSFANLRNALRPGGRLVFACWREPRENPWMMAPLQAVYKHVAEAAAAGTRDPGPFAFASEERVKRILARPAFPA